MKYIYIQTDNDPALFTVGFYKPDESFEPESDHADRNEAVKRVRFLNGGEDIISNEVVADYQTVIEKIARSFNITLKPWLDEKTLINCKPLLDAIDRQHKDTLLVEKELQDFLDGKVVTIKQLTEGMELVINLQKRNDEVRADMENLGTINDGLKQKLACFEQIDRSKNV